MEFISKKIEESIQLKEKINKDSELKNSILKASKRIVEALKQGNKVLLCGNGGSAADAQHLTAELLGKFNLSRNPLPAISLTTNTSSLTAIANDFSFDEVFLRQLKGLGKSGDILISISTSGNSTNVLKAMEYAKENNIINIAFTGEDGGKMKFLADILINVPSKVTARIQEVHILIGHIMCEIIEKELFASQTH